MDPRAERAIPPDWLHTGSEPPERSSNIEITGNVIDEEPSTCLPAIFVEPFQYPPGQFRTNYTIKGNQFKALGTAMLLTGIASSKIESNVVTKKYGNGCVPAAYAVELRNARDVNVFGNALRGAEGEWAGELLAPPPSSTITQRP